MSAVERCRVFVACSSDLTDERARLGTVIDDLNRTVGRDLSLLLELTGWDLDAAPGVGRPQDLINHLVDECDIFVGIMWRRFGIPSGVYGGGTEEEYERAYGRWSSGGRPEILFYFCERAIRPPSTAAEADQLAAVARMRERLQDQALVGTFADIDDFERSVRKHLHLKLRAMYGSNESPVLAPGLRALLENRLAFSRERDVAFRTPSILLALLDIRGGIATQCLDAIEPGLAVQVADRLSTFVSDGEVAGGARFDEVDIDRMPLIARATEIAARHKSSTVTEHHLFVAVMQSKSDVVSGLARRLGPDKAKELIRLAEQGGPSRPSTGTIDF